MENFTVQISFEHQDSLDSNMQSTSKQVQQSMRFSQEEAEHAT